MNDDAFDTLVFELEKKARLAPERYELQVLLLALLGNAFFALVFLSILALFLASLALLMTFKWLALAAVLPLGLFLWTLIKALRVPIPAPAGLALEATQAPQLFALIEEVRTALGAPRLHKVLITEDYNAAVVQVPQLGMLGWYHNCLLVGLPLMKSLNHDQFKAVLAHELGHLSRGHGRLSNWIWRQRLRWSQLEQALEQDSTAGSLVLAAFLGWFAPRFNARSFPLARANEYEADAISVRLTSSRIAAEALTNVNVIASYLGERYWPAIHRQAEELPHPGYAPYSSMGSRFAAELDPASTELWLEQSLWRKTTSGDTHPALSDRLQAIGEPARLMPPAAGQSADLLLGNALATVAQAFDDNWRRSVLPSWQQRHSLAQKGRRRLKELDQTCNRGATLPLADAYERALLTENIAHDYEAALQQFRDLQLRAPHDAQLALDLGGRLLARHDASGCVMLERAMRLDDTLAIQCCELLQDFCSRNARASEAEMWQARLADLHRRARECNELQMYDCFGPHDLNRRELQGLVSQLGSLKGIRSAYLVRKHVSHTPSSELYVLGVRCARRFPLQRRLQAGKILEQLGTLSCPGETLLLTLDGEYHRFERTFQRIAGSRIL